METGPSLFSVYIFVRDLQATLSFYRLLGLPIEQVSDAFARTTLPNGVMLEFGTPELTRSYDPKWQAPAGPGHNSINLELPSSEAVDTTYEALTRAGHVGHLAPFDPPWGARFAIVHDPDGNPIGLHGPRDRDAERRRE